MELVWWHWLVLGMVLMGIEMLTPTFFLMWFGLGAVLVGLTVAVLPLDFTAQVLGWALASAAMTGVWLKFFRNPDRTHAGRAKEGVVGVAGLVSRAIPEMGQGEVLFQRPILGSDRWPAVADAPIPAGEKVRIVDVLGQTLRVERL
ncbi:MAG TPA: NfeD family protein [Thiobacillaceae bacterium]|nr:NfeD family protein [Thiobacillaceae bacterium]HNU63765.1 NfeD family protein [Thiobacillaceae bacterium]